MYYKRLLIIISGVFLLFSCNEDPKLVFYETSFTTEENSMVEVILPLANGTDETLTNTINNTIKIHVINALKIGGQEAENSQTIEESIRNFNTNFETFKKDFPEAHPWDAQIDGEVMYQSSEIISISLSSYLNTGGAHGNLNITFLNFDAETGKPIKNEDLISNLEAFKKTAEIYFEDTVEDKDILFDPASFQLPENIGFNEEGMILLYNTYEVAPYATGIIEFTIPYDEIRSVLNFNGS